MKTYVQFRYYDLAIREREVIYTYLTKSFYVMEEETSIDEIEKEQSYVMGGDDPLTYIELSFSSKFDDLFFSFIRPEMWHSIKNIIKEIKHRRGKMPVVVLFKFIGANNINSEIVFCIKNKFEKQFDMAIEKIEYLVDIIPSQLNLLPETIIQVVYFFDDSYGKWIPFQATNTNRNESSRFAFSGGKWTIIG
ncbi:MAG: hypothetical protein R3321_09485 [Nitrososphaeraceae archaeon]|nr:hypothetical protein [Nitrososphaeraceae archaeon]